MSFKRSALANLSGQVTVAAIQLLVIPRYVSYVGIEAYGLVGIYISIQAAAQLLDLGMSAAVNRQLSRAAALSEDVSRTRDFLRTGEVLYVTGGLGLGVLLFALAPTIAAVWIPRDALPAEQVVDALRLIAVLTAVQWPLTFYQGALLGLHRAGVMNVIRVSAALVSSAGALVVLDRVSPTIGALFTWQIGVAIAQVSALAICAWRAMPAGPSSRFNFRAMHGLTSFAVGMTAVTATATVVTQMDKVVLSHFVPLAQFGYYTLASVIGNGFSTVVAALFVTMLPAFSRLVAQDDNAGVSLLYRRIWGLMTALALPLALVVAAFSREVMLLWTRSTETATITAPLLALLIVGSALNGLMAVVYALQLARGDTRLPLRLSLLMGLIGLPLLALLVPRYGTVGAAAVWPIVNACYMAVGIPATTRSFAPASVAPWIRQTVIAPAVLAGAIVLALRWLLPRTDDPGLLLIHLAVSWALAVAAVFRDEPASPR